MNNCTVFGEIHNSKTLTRPHVHRKRERAQRGGGVILFLHRGWSPADRRFPRHPRHPPAAHTSPGVVDHRAQGCENIHQVRVENVARVARVGGDPVRVCHGVAVPEGRGGVRVSGGDFAVGVTEMVG